MSLYRRDRRRKNPNQAHPQGTEELKRGIRRYQRRYSFSAWPVLGQDGNKSVHGWLRRSWVPSYFTLPWFEPRNRDKTPETNDNNDQPLETESLHED